MRSNELRVVGLGAGGHAKVIIEILRLRGDYEVAGLLDARSELHGTDVLGVRVLGDDTLLTELFQQGVHYAFVGFGSVGVSSARQRVYEQTKRAGFKVVSAVHPQAVISQFVQMGEGLTVMAGAVINASACIGDNVIVNTGAIIEHDCAIGSHTHIATGARLAGGVQVADGVHVGMGANVRQGIRIGRHAIVGAGAVVVKDVPEGAIVVGVPARPLIKEEGQRSNV